MESKEEAARLVGVVLDGKYQLEAVVGRGGFGVVYRARHLIWDQAVAIKVLTKLTNVAEDMREEVLGLFVREGRLLSTLSSRTTGIVQARDIGTMTTQLGLWMPYMVLEWLDGHTLGRLLRAERGAGGGPRGVREVFHIFDGVARALAVAHASGVAHRDIKPPNIFVLGDALAPGVVIKLLDFGIAKVMQTTAPEGLEMTGAQQSMFTPLYGAPEQFNRKLGASGPWTDVFAMALVILEVMTGRRVLTGESFGELTLECLDPSRRPTPRTLGVEVSDAVEAVFARALAIATEARYRTMGDFWLDLVDALEIEAYPPLPLERLSDAASSAGLVIGEPSAVMAVDELSGASLGSLRALDSQSREAMSTRIPEDARTGADAAAARPSRGRGAALVAVSGVIAIGVAVGVLALSRGEATPDPGGAAQGLERAQDAGERAPAQAAAATGSPAASPCPEGMVHIAGGKYFMGSDVPDVPALALAHPAHKVEVGPFCLDRTEVTVAAYRECSAIGECKRAHSDAWWPQGSTPEAAWRRQREAHSPLCNGDAAARDEHPVNCVTWAQADEYCRFAGKRLPREIEWEYAARGSDGRVFPWGDEPPSAARVNGCGEECVAWRVAAALEATPTLYDVDDGFPGTAPVGSFPQGATQAGVLDIIGNLFEWTADAYKPYDDEGDGDPERRVIRGGAFNSYQPEHANPALRYPMAAESHSHGIGFRCASEPRGDAAPPDGDGDADAEKDKDA
ncbi:MAG: bifunctional serine/threonine-protein kinase/formylglycine-generating enzyme family protein [Nannocystaceae bacterium]